jgi:inorganic triphosphatase YgiF
MDAPRDIELKFEVDPASLGQLRAHPLLRNAKPSSRRLAAVYFDTDKLALHEAKLLLSTRRDGRRHLQAIEASVGAGTLCDHPKWQAEIRGEQLDSAQLKGTPVAALVKHKKLRPRLKTRVRRALRTLKANGAAIDVALDRVELDAGKGSIAFTELALTLVRGEPVRLFETAAQLTQAVPLRLEARNRAVRGYEMLDGGTPRASRAEPVALDRHMSVASAFQIIARECLRHLAANAPGIVARDDAEAVHQMRVATRRLRAAMSLFGDFVGDTRLEDIKTELRWIAGSLAEARGIDVFMTDVLEPMRRRHPREPGMFELAKYFAERRHHAHEEARGAVGSPRFNEALIALAAWIETGPWCAPADAQKRAELDMPVLTLATEELERRCKRILRQGRSIKKLDPQSRHALRIRVKKLRYATDFFSSLYRKQAKRQRKFVGSLERFQDLLGELNDLTSAREMEARLVRQGQDGSASGTERAFAAGLITGHRAAWLKPLLKDTAKAYAKFRKARPFW